MVYRIHALANSSIRVALKVRAISSAAGSGLEDLKEDFWKVVGQAKASQAVDSSAAWSEEDG